MRYHVCIDGPISAGKSTLVAAVRDGLRAKGVPVAVAAEPVKQWVGCGILTKFYEAVNRPLAEGEVDETAYGFQTFAFVTRVAAIAAARREIAAAERPRRGPPSVQDVIKVAQPFALVAGGLLCVDMPLLWVMLTCLAAAGALLANDILTQRNNRVDTVLLCERSGYTDRHVFVTMLKDRFGPMYLHMYQTWWDYWYALDGRPARATEKWVQVYLRPSLDTCMGRFEDRKRAGESLKRDYQEALIAQHDHYLQSGDFEGQRPFAPEDVLVIEGDLAAGDFREGGKERAEVVERIVAHIGIN